MTSTTTWTDPISEFSAEALAEIERAADTVGLSNASLSVAMPEARAIAERHGLRPIHLIQDAAAQ